MPNRYLGSLPGSVVIVGKMYLSLSAEKKCPVMSGYSWRDPGHLPLLILSFRETR